MEKHQVMASIKRPTAYQMRLLLGSLFALVVAHGLITSFLVQYDLAREWNPFLQRLVGGQQFMMVKMVGAAAIVFLLWSMYRRRPALAAITAVCKTATDGSISKLESSRW